MELNIRYFRQEYFSLEQLIDDANLHAWEWNLISFIGSGCAIYAVYEKKVAAKAFEMQMGID
jgi:hypothetical protein